jgi:hypothetical protein
MPLVLLLLAALVLLLQVLLGQLLVQFLLGLNRKVSR